MSHGFSAAKEMVLDTFAEAFVSKVLIACLVHDNRGFGSSDCGFKQAGHEVIPSVQIADMQDAITYAQIRDEVDEVDVYKIGVWGSSLRAGHCLQVAAVNKRVKACISQVGRAENKAFSAAND